MPATSIRDLVVKDDDLVVGTHGRAFWILDDITPLRQLDAGRRSRRQRTSSRRRRRCACAGTRTPTRRCRRTSPPAQNPPDGAIIDYYLKAAARHRSTLEILDAAGPLVRRYASDDPPEPPVEGRNIPDYWIRPPQLLSAEAGLHRFVWDLRHEPPAASSFGYPIAAIAATRRASRAGRGWCRGRTRCG